MSEEGGIFSCINNTKTTSLSAAKVLRALQLSCRRSHRHFHTLNGQIMVKAMQHAGRRAFIAALVLLLLVAIHAAAKTNVASMMADRQSQSTGDEAVSAALTRKTLARTPKAVLLRKKAIAKTQHQPKEDEPLPTETVDSQASNQVEVVAKQMPGRSQETRAVGYTWVKRGGDCAKRMTMFA